MSSDWVPSLEPLTQKERQRLLDALSQNSNANPPVPYIPLDARKKLRDLIASGDEREAWIEYRRHAQLAAGMAFESAMNKARKFRTLEGDRRKTSEDHSKKIATLTANVTPAPENQTETAPTPSAPAVRVNKLKTRKRELDAEIADAYARAALPKTFHSVFALLKDDAVNGKPPFTGQFNDKGSIGYTSVITNEVTYLSLRALRTRIKDLQNSATNSDE